MNKKKPAPFKQFSVHTLFYFMVMALCLINGANATSTNNSNIFSLMILFSIIGGIVLLPKKTSFASNPLGYLSLFFALSIGTSTLIMLINTLPPIHTHYYLRSIGIGASPLFTWVLIHYINEEKASAIENIFLSLLAAFWIIVIFGYLRSYLENNFIWDQPPFFRNIRQGGVLCAALTAPMVYLYLFSKNNIVRLLSLISLALALSFIMLTGARGAALSLAMATLYLLWVLKGTINISSLLKTTLTIVIFTSITSISISQLISTDQSLLNRTTPTITNTPAYSGHVISESAIPPAAQAATTLHTLPRLHIWNETLKGIDKHNVWFGRGPDTYRHYTPHLIGVQPHNSFLLALIEWGVIGSFILIGLLSAVVKKGLVNIQNASSPRSRALYATGLFTFTSITLMGMVDGTYYHAFSLFFIFLSIALMLQTEKTTSVKDSCIK